MKSLFWRKSRDHHDDNHESLSGNSNSSWTGDNSSSSLTGNNKNTGAFSIFRLTVPVNFVPGQETQVFAGSKLVPVRFPLDAVPGQILQIKIPVDPSENDNDQQSLQDTTDSPNVRIINDPNARGTAPAYMVSIPDGVCEGELFPVTIRGQRLMVTCPPTFRPGMSVRIVPQLRPENPNPPRPSDVPNDTRRTKEKTTQTFEVVVPPGVQPGQPFSIRARGVRVLVTCPITASPGQRIRFELPIALTQKEDPVDDIVKIKLSYDKDGWQRTIRSDMKFQWVRVDDKGEVETNTRFHITKSAYARKLEFKPSDDPHIRSGVLSFVPANEAVVDSHIKASKDKDLVTYTDIANTQVKSFNTKTQWFQGKCKELRTEWSQGHIRISVRRELLLEDSVKSILSMRRKDMRKTWNFVFIKEAGIDAGGLKREWFHLVTSKLFDPDTGLWQSSACNQMCMEINPASESCCEDHLDYYRFLGRVMGKALFDNELVTGHMVQYIYKHILGWPITFSELQMVDEEYYNNMKSLDAMNQNGDDIGLLSLDFTVTEEIVGRKEEIALVEDGANVEVTNDNFPEYIEACVKYRMLDRVKPQLTELLLGFFDVIPEPLLTIFDFQELELLMCGLPVIKLDDWMENTEYSGEYGYIGVEHRTCEWFWQVVAEFDQETKARLLQFVTGTSGVPSRGFGVLQGSDGNIRKFTLHGVELGVCLYPRAHTCFNRLDLPTYESKAELLEKLTLAVTMAATGFDIE